MNEEIRAREVRVIGPDAKMLGVFPTSQALQLARDFGLDLIEVAPEAAPPTCKIMDYGKWKYENKKKTQANKKKQVIIQLKEIQVRLRTDDHDLDVKLRHARRFLLEGDKVKFSMRFQGREMTQMESAREMMRRMAATLGDLANIESDPKSEGRQMFMIVAPDALKVKEYRLKHPQGNKKDVAAADEAVPVDKAEAEDDED
ncbi:MAG: translation initiation factor IF-3 [Bdellovibrionaceae bacterium]|nr:translation initiation factor IF-3 [Pseudobdellovibrionaceae bacterium]